MLLSESTRPPSSKERGKGAAPLYSCLPLLNIASGVGWLKRFGRRIIDWKAQGALGKSAISFSEQKIILLDLIAFGLKIDNNMRHPPYQPFYTSVTAPGDQTNRRRSYGRRGSISSQRISSQQITLNQIHANNSHDSYDASSYNDRMVARGGNKIAPPNAAFGSIRDSPISISSRPQLKNSSSTNILPMRGRKNSKSWPPSSRRNGNFSPRGRARGMMLTPNNNSRYKQRSQHQQQQSFQHNYKTEEGYEGENASPNSYDSQETYDYARERHQQQQQQQHDDVTPHSLLAADNDNDSSSNIRGGDMGGYAITRSIQPPGCSNLGITALAAGVSMCRTKSSKTG